MNEDMLMSRVVDLTAEAKALENQLYQERLQVTETRAQLSKLNAALKCQICLTNEVTHVMAPCGHTICLDCSDQLQQRNRYTVVA